jgi:ArsR family transcriptional regulator, arsenate/arsenite/antimonite-responsive transcriptional repressor
MRGALRTFKGLADPIRLRIVRLLGRGPLCVCELTDILGLEQSRMSHQLQLLREAAIVEVVREGRWKIYRIPKDQRAAIASILKTAFKGNPADLESLRKDVRDLERCRRKNLRGIASSCPSTHRRPETQAGAGTAKSPKRIAARKRR